MKTEKYQIIFNMALAGYLMQKGFVLINMRSDNRGSGRNVFFFNNSSELQKEIASYTCKDWCKGAYQWIIQIKI